MPGIQNTNLHLLKNGFSMTFYINVYVSVYECVPNQIRSGVSFIQHLNVVRHLASSATENCL